MKSIICSLAAAASLATGLAYAEPATQAYGLTSTGTLVQFKLNRALRTTVIGSTLNGLVTDTAIVGIDFRVQNGALYGVGNMGGIYTINTVTGASTKLSMNVLTTALSGTQFDIDFNPAADRLRVVSDNGQNLRHNVGPATFTTLVDMPLTYTMAATGIGGAAYTNNDLSSLTGTVLYDIDATLNRLTIQAPANNGTLTDVGALGVDPVGAVGFDIQSIAPNSSSATVDNLGYAAMTLNGETISKLFSIDLTTGAAKLLGTFPAGQTIVDIAFPLPVQYLD